jgi:hypothetical protein
VFRKTLTGFELVSPGITDLAVKAYMLAQERAIGTKKELVDASIIGIRLKKSGKSEIRTPEVKKAVLPKILASPDNVSNKNIHPAWICAFRQRICFKYR